MQNSIQFPYPFSSFNLASMFDLSNLHHHHHPSNHGLPPGTNPNSAPLTINSIHSNNSSSSVHSSTSDSTDLHHHHHHHPAHHNSLSPQNSNKSPSPHHHLDAATAAAMSRLLFPPSLLAHSLCGFSPPEEVLSSKDKFFKRGGVSSKSFTIDSLLGLNNVAAARAVIQSGIVPPHHHHHHHHHQSSAPVNGINLSTSISGGTVQSWKKSENNKEHNNHRYHPYQHHPSNNNTSLSNSNLNTTLPLSSSNNNHSLNNNNQIHPSQSSNHNQSSNNSSSNPAKSKTSSQNIAPPGSSDKTQESSSQSSRRAAKAKRVRTIFTPEQLERLEAEFERQQYMVGPERLYLASSLHLTEAQVKVWFQNRRIKWRKQHLEIQQQRLAALRSQHDDPEDESSNEFDGSASPTPTDASSTCINDIPNIPSAQTSPNSFSSHIPLSNNHSMRDHFPIASSHDLADRESSISPKQLHHHSPISLPTDRRQSLSSGDFS